MKPSGDERPAKKSRRVKTQTDGPVVFDEPSELFLRVGADHVEEAVVFSVCPKALTRLSKVFAKMLNGGLAESRPADKQQRWEIELPDDKPASLQILMDIMHGRVREVPNKLGLTDLWDVIVAADKYDVVHLLQPWRGWINAVEHRTLEMRLLGIAWHLKDFRIFSQMINSIAEKAGLNENREMYFQYNGESGARHDLSELLNGFVPSRIIDQLPDLRSRLVSAVLQPYVDIIHGWVAKVPAEPTSDVIAGLVLIAAKYDAIAVLRPYAETWTRRLEADPSPFPGLIEYIKDGLRALYVNSELGHANRFRAKFLFLIWRIRFDDEVWGVLVKQDQQIIDIYEHLDANGIIQALKDVHHTAIRSYLDVFRGLRDELADDDWCISSRPNSRKRCTCMLLGSLLAEVINQKVPLVDTADGGWELGGQGTWTLRRLYDVFTVIKGELCAMHEDKQPRNSVESCLVRAQQQFVQAGIDLAKQGEEHLARSCREGGWDDRMRPSAELLGLEFVGCANCDVVRELAEKGLESCRIRDAGGLPDGIQADGEDSSDSDDSSIF